MSDWLYINCLIQARHRL